MTREHKQELLKSLGIILNVITPDIANDLADIHTLLEKNINETNFDRFKPPEGYRFLTIGETIEPGDNYLISDDWIEPSPGFPYIGERWHPNDHPLMARRIAS